MNVAYGEERNAWLVELSFGIAAGAGIIFALMLLVLLRGPLLRLLAVPLRPLAPALTGIRFLLIMTPLRVPLRRYLYVGRHLAIQRG